MKRSDVCEKHGTAAVSRYSHLAISVEDENTSGEWCEPVDAEEYAKPA